MGQQGSKLTVPARGYHFTSSCLIVYMLSMEILPAIFLLPEGVQIHLSPEGRLCGTLSVVTGY